MAKSETTPKSQFRFRVLLFTATVLTAFISALASEPKIEIRRISDSFEDCKKSSAPNLEKFDEPATKESDAEKKCDSANAESEPVKEIFIEPFGTGNEWLTREKLTLETERRIPLLKKTFSKDESAPTENGKFHWKPALIQSGIFLGIQHGYRLTQERTRQELGGPFFKDWGKSVRGLRGWNDPDNFFINYIAHPLQGGLTGRIFVANSDRARRQEFGKSQEYWKSRLKAMAWSAAWSTQFELGPISEASFGNVGIREKRGRSTMAYVDLVVTPTIGTGVVVGEDAIDKYILKNWVERNAHRTTLKIRILRSVLTPTTSIQNLLRGKVPWKRDGRLLK